MDNSGHHASGVKKRSIDDIINNITSDLQSYEGRYMVLGNPRQSTDFMWQQVNNYATPQQSNIYNSDPINMTNNNQYLNTNQYNPFIQSPQTSIPPGFLNYDPQLYSHHHHHHRNQHSHHHLQQHQHQQQQPHQIHPPQQQRHQIHSPQQQPHQIHPPQQHVHSSQQLQHQVNYTCYQQSQYAGHPVSYQTPSYGLFDAPCNDALIENLVQSWNQTQNGGVFSPFGNQAFQTSREMIPESENSLINPLPVNHKSNCVVTPVKKVRMVAEVRPMRPSYSDVLAKSPASGPIKKIAACTQVDTLIDIKNTNKSKTSSKKKKSANKVSKEDCCLKRQNSSASSEERNLNFETKEDKKFEVTISHNDKIWTSSEDLNGSEYYEADENAYSNIQVPKVKENTKKEKIKVKTKTTPKNAGNNFKPNKEDTDKKKIKKNMKSNIVNKNMIKEQPNKKNNEFNLTNNEYIDVQNDNEKLSSKICSTLPQQSSKNQGSRSTATFTALPFKARYQRGVKKRPRNSAINTMITKHFGYLRTQFIQYAPIMVFWFIHLLWDVVTMSIHLLIHLSVSGVTQLIETCKLFWNNFWISLSTPFSSATSWARVRWKDTQTGNTLNINIPLPTTGEEALKRLLACKGKDPYSILGVTADSTEDDIKKYYKRQAVLVHPDKNNQSGAEEAFKILNHAFNMIGDPEKRKLYDSGIEHIKENYDELNKLLKNLHEKMAQVSNTIRCTSCGKRHKRKLILCRPMYAARFCALCNVHHSARDGDIWAESSLFGLRWKYYGCMDGGVYNISDWATCQQSSLKHMRADTHSVQYRIIFGGKQQTPEPTVSPSPPLQPRTQAPPPTPLFDFNQPHLDEFLSSFYQHHVPGSATNGEFGTTDIPRQRTKNKRKK